ncbi:CBS domain-containing protein [Nocardia sp. NPDC060259]|uniref:CBS domain-containing protein n=1 Tax=Nocardia sp. NPDC060259 TaxID=3347088 RepID=UPI00365F2FC8
MRTQHPTEEQLHALRGVTMPVKDLVQRFGFPMRTYETVPLITKALNDAGLTTKPDFARCRREIAVTIVDLDDKDPEPIVEPAEGFQPTVGLQRQFLIGDLPSARGKLEFVGPDASLAAAVHIMRTGNYSQVPVIAGTSDLRGVVTWKSVARLLHMPKPAASLSDVMETSVEVAETHQQLFPRLPLINTKGFLLVRERDGVFSGIITTADIADWFHQGALPFFLVGEIEEKLRRVLAPIPSESIALLQPKNRKTGNIEDMMFGQYIILLDPDGRKPEHAKHANQNWSLLGWSTTDRVNFVRQLNLVREIRNRIAHFNAKPLSEADLDTLKRFVRILDDHLP